MCFTLRPGPPPKSSTPATAAHNASTVNITTATPVVNHSLVPQMSSQLRLADIALPDVISSEMNQTSLSSVPLPYRILSSLGYHDTNSSSNNNTVKFSSEGNVNISDVSSQLESAVERKPSRIKREAQVSHTIDI